MKDFIKNNKLAIFYLMIVLLTFLLQVNSHNIRYLTNYHTSNSPSNYGTLFWSENHLNIKFLFIFILYLVFGAFYFKQYIQNIKSSKFIIYIPIIIIVTKIILLLLANVTGILTSDYSSISIFTKLFLTSTFYSYSFVSVILDAIILTILFYYNNQTINENK